jgi:hypothetical protein
VMLGEPIARVAEVIGKPREVERISQRSRSGGGGGHRRQIKDGQRNQAGSALTGENDRSIKWVAAAGQVKPGAA